MAIEGLLVDRFWNKISRSEGCWTWIGAKGHFGYGVMRIRDKLIYAHRISYDINKGSIPDDKCVLHHCDNPACVNPDHLFLGSKKENNYDKFNKKRHYKGTDQHLSKLTELDVLTIRALRHWSGFSQKEIAAEYNITPSNVSQIVRGYTWRHIRTNFNR